MCLSSALRVCNQTVRSLNSLPAGWATRIHFIPQKWQTVFCSLEGSNFCCTYPSHFDRRQELYPSRLNRGVKRRERQADVFFMERTQRVCYILFLQYQFSYSFFLSFSVWEFCGCNSVCLQVFAWYCIVCTSLPICLPDVAAYFIYSNHLHI